MLSKRNIVMFLVTGTAFIVVACGNNPEKSRILPDASSSVLKSASKNAYSSAAGHSFTIDKKSKEMTFTTTVVGRRVSVEFDPLSKILTLDDVYGADRVQIQASQVEDGFQPLLDLWEDHKEQNPELSAAALKSSGPFKNLRKTLDCFETRSGSMGAVYQRPKDLSVKYKAGDALYVLQENPDANYTAQLTIGQTASASWGELNLDSESLYSTYTKEEAPLAFFGKICELEAQFDSAFSSMFDGVSTNYAGDTTGTLALVEFNEKIFQLAGMFDDQNGFNPDSHVYSAGEHTIDLYQFVSQKIPGSLQSGHLESGSWNTQTQQYETQKIFDNFQYIWKMDYENRKMTFYSDDSSQACVPKLSGNILEAGYSTRKQSEHTNAIRVVVRLENVNYSPGCLTESNALQVGDEVSMYVEFRRRDDEFSMVMLDEKRQIEVLSSKSYIAN